MTGDNPFPEGFRLVEIDETGSTNADCLAAARACKPGGLWIRAGRQTGGRGSRGRDWHSPAGNLYASLMIDIPPRTVMLPTLTFAAALGLADALERLATGQRRDLDIGLKWPNDVLLSGRKAAGILLESHTIGERRVAIIGIGVNCRSHPEGTTHPATSLSHEGLGAGPVELMPMLAAALAGRLGQWRWGHGFAETRADWLARATGLGEPIRVRLQTAEYAGVFETIDDNGLLVLALSNGSRRKFSVADVFLSLQAQVDTVR